MVETIRTYYRYKPDTPGTNYKARIATSAGDTQLFHPTEQSIKKGNFIFNNLNNKCNSISEYGKVKQ